MNLVVKYINLLMNLGMLQIPHTKKVSGENLQFLEGTGLFEPSLRPNLTSHLQTGTLKQCLFMCNVSRKRNNAEKRVLFEMM